jgi:hypothetical protein
MASVIEKRIASLEQRKAAGGRLVHFIKATDTGHSHRQIAELQAAGKVGPRDGFLTG